MSVGALALLLADQSARAVPALLTLTTVRLATQALTAKATLATASVGLVGGVLKAVIATRTGVLLTLLLVVGLAAAGVGVLASQPETPKPAPPPSPQAARPAEQPKTEPVAEVKTSGSPVDRQGDPLPEGALARLGTSRLGHGAVICSIAFSGDNKLVATAGFDSFVNVWDASTGQRLLHVSAANFREGSNVANVALSPDGSWAPRNRLDQLAARTLGRADRQKTLRHR